MSSQYSINDIINSINTTNNNLYQLKKYCLEQTELYYNHLKRWLSFFKPQQLFLIDTDLFIKAPIRYLNSLQKFFNIDQIFDYNEKLILKGSQYCIM